MNKLRICLCDCDEPHIEEYEVEPGYMVFLESSVAFQESKRSPLMFFPLDDFDWLEVLDPDGRQILTYRPR